jgi:acyl-CoA hydrolase
MVREVSLADLANALSPGETVFIAGSAGEPQAFTQWLVDHPQSAPGVRFITSFVPGINRRNLAATGTKRSMQVFFMSPALAQSRAEGRVQFSPMSYSGIRQWLIDPKQTLDTAIVQLSPPDAQNRCSLGAAVEFMPDILRRARRLFAVINPQVPVLPGSPALSLDRFEAVAQGPAPLAQYDAGASNPLTERIVAHLAALIPDGATLQLGLGKVPAHLLPALHRHRELAIHSGMLSDAALDLPASGCLRAESAPLLAGVAVGSQAFYQRLPQLAGLRLESVAYTHDAERLRALPRLHAINSALEVDLLGQANAEMLDGVHVSGPGGSPDFSRAARLQADGLSIIALPSTDPDGRLSRIVARFEAGTPVTVPQHDVDVVVTEYGTALLRGVDLDERRHRLIGIAHPDHREALQKSAWHSPHHPHPPPTR